MVNLISTTSVAAAKEMAQQAATPTQETKAAKTTPESQMKDSVQVDESVVINKDSKSAPNNPKAIQFPDINDATPATHRRPSTSTLRPMSPCQAERMKEKLKYLERRQGENNLPTPSHLRPLTQEELQKRAKLFEGLNKIEQPKPEGLDELKRKLDNCELTGLTVTERARRIDPKNREGALSQGTEISEAVREKLERALEESKKNREPVVQ